LSILDEPDATDLGEVPRNLGKSDAGGKQFINEDVTSSSATPDAGFDEDLFSLVDRWLMHFLD
jgi:hypothetical protein